MVADQVAHVARLNPATPLSRSPRARRRRTSSGESAHGLGDAVVTITDDFDKDFG